MEWKEHVAWFAPISITMAAFVFIEIWPGLKNHPRLRSGVLGLTLASFVAAGIAGSRSDDQQIRTGPGPHRDPFKAKGKMTTSNDVLPAKSPGQTNGSGAAAVLSAGIGCLFLQFLPSPVINQLLSGPAWSSINRPGLVRREHRCHFRLAFGVGNPGAALAEKHCCDGTDQCRRCYTIGIGSVADISTLHRPFLKAYASFDCGLLGMIDDQAVYRSLLRLELESELPLNIVNRGLPHRDGHFQVANALGFALKHIEREVESTVDSGHVVYRAADRRQVRQEIGEKKISGREGGHNIKPLCDIAGPAHALKVLFAGQGSDFPESNHEYTSKTPHSGACINFCSSGHSPDCRFCTDRRDPSLRRRDS